MTNASAPAKAGIADLNKICKLEELAKGGLMTTESVVMRASSGTVRWVKGEHRNRN